MRPRRRRRRRRPGWCGCRGRRCGGCRSRRARWPASRTTCGERCAASPPPSCCSTAGTSLTIMRCRALGGVAYLADGRGGGACTQDGCALGRWRRGHGAVVQVVPGWAVRACPQGAQAASESHAPGQLTTPPPALADSMHALASRCERAPTPPRRRTPRTSARCPRGWWCRCSSSAATLRGC
eukprot:COSAG01_NODE_6133_length_3833_cov_1.660150_6_plen_182_part_00